MALPVELTWEQSISLVREYVKQVFVAAGMSKQPAALFDYKSKFCAICRFSASTTLRNPALSLPLPASNTWR